VALHLGPRRFHEQVTAALVESEAPELDTREQAEVEGFVARQLVAMPPHLRLGVSAVAVLLSTTGRGRVEPERWDASRVPFVPLYVRMLRSLVLFAAYETRATLK
jgi:hypothetical protein